ncbi:MAG: formate dehydrogenase accessory sulfurtransferase FdhD [Thermoanaerobaculia bacterium]
MSDETTGPSPDSVARSAVRSVADGESRERSDLLAVEEPLEVRVVVEKEGRRRRHRIAVTMRTPGHDFELAAGFLYSEGALGDVAAVARIAYCQDGEVEEARNIVELTLAPGIAFDPARFSRTVYTSSSCGVCGRGSLELVRAALPATPGKATAGPRLEGGMLLTLPDRLAGAQATFAATGGLHAAALFDPSGALELVREDVGRHNAVDKVVGALLLDGRLPAADRLLLVSGRASFELVQKAVLAGLPALAAVGAPSSLAVELARDHGMTLIGFLRDARFNVYAGEHRVA